MNSTWQSYSMDTAINAIVNEYSSDYIIYLQCHKYYQNIIYNKDEFQRFSDKRVVTHECYASRLLLVKFSIALHYYLNTNVFHLLNEVKNRYSYD